MTIPLSALWLDAEAVVRMLSLSGRFVRERIALRVHHRAHNHASTKPTATAHPRSNVLGDLARSSLMRSSAFTPSPARPRSRRRAWRRPGAAQRRPLARHGSLR